MTHLKSTRSHHQHTLILRNLLRNIFSPTATLSSRPKRAQQEQPQQQKHKRSPTPRAQQLERLRQEAEATFDLHDCMERWMRGDDPVFGVPSHHWKATHPQMNYHLQRIRHREQHELWGPDRLPACTDKDRATIAFLNSGGDPEETRCWPEGLEEEFLDSLIRQWKSDTGF